jgi:hypothetical protein
MSLATIEPDLCPECGPKLVVESWAEDALLRHGGYGETRRTTVTKCSLCGLELRRQQSSERPR